MLRNMAVMHMAVAKVTAQSVKNASAEPFSPTSQYNGSVNMVTPRTCEGMSDALGIIRTCR